LQFSQSVVHTGATKNQLTPTLMYDPSQRKSLPLLTEYPNTAAYIEMYTASSSSNPTEAYALLTSCTRHIFNALACEAYQYISAESVPKIMNVFFQAKNILMADPTFVTKNVVIIPLENGLPVLPGKTLKRSKNQIQEKRKNNLKKGKKNLVKNISML
jgi:hypothetical protein